MFLLPHRKPRKGEKSVACLVNFQFDFESILMEIVVVYFLHFFFIPSYVFCKYEKKI